MGPRPGYLNIRRNGLEHSKAESKHFYMRYFSHSLYGRLSCDAGSNSVTFKLTWPVTPVLAESSI